MPGATPNMAQSFVIGHSILSQWTGGASSQVLFLLADGHGSTQMVVNTAGSIVESYDYDAYGNLINPSATPLTNHLYTGEQFDSRTGQYYLRARYYDAATGRFSRLDPYAGSSQHPLTLHKYAYCAASPVMCSDPTGQFTFVDVLGSMSIGAVISAATTAMFVVPSWAKGDISGEEAIKQIGLSALTGALGGAAGGVASAFASQYFASKVLQGAITGMASAFAASVADEFVRYFCGEEFVFADAGKRVGAATFSGVVLGGFLTKISMHYKGPKPVRATIKGHPSLNDCGLVTTYWSDIPVARNAKEASIVVMLAIAEGVFGAAFVDAVSE